ncbi:MAG: L-histidine N(alpha)-methyltransferase [Gammaproteobacteria bacterium]
MTDSNLELYDFQPEPEDFLQGVLQGLSQSQPEVSPKYLYDDKGSELFDRICDTDEYYVTRMELELLAQKMPEIAQSIPPDVSVIEMGVGMSVKAETVLKNLDNPALYVATDINRMALEKALHHLSRTFPALDLAGVVTDFTKDWALPEDLAGRSEHKLCFMPGSTLGNFSEQERGRLLKTMTKLVAPSGQLLLGLDLVKPVSVLESAYNDATGVTASFNTNLLSRMSTELEADLDPDAFVHHAFYNPKMQRVEIHLRALSDQAIEVAGRRFLFAEGDSIHTENSHKFRIEQVEELAAEAGFQSCQVWTDSNGWIGLFLLTL